MSSAPSDAQSYAGLAQATTAQEWQSAAEVLTAEEGYVLPLGADHLALFCDNGPKLLVSFEEMDAILARPSKTPAAHDIARKNGWSHLCIVAKAETWFRDPAVYAYFDRLVDEAFLEDFDQVLFYGVQAGAYAACAYSVAAPAAQVLALNPRASLAPEWASWDNRYAAARRRDFTSRYGFAPAMLNGAAAATLIYDPTLPLEAMHAALFHAPHVRRFAARHSGLALALILEDTQNLPPLLEAAMAATLTPQVFTKLWRKRRGNGHYLRGLLAKVSAAGKTQREIAICHNVSSRMRAPRFAKRLAQLTTQSLRETQATLEPQAAP